MNQLSKDNAIESFEKLYGSIKEVLNESRQQAYQAVNSSMLLAYWSIGKIIVENEQDGQFRGEYGKYTLSDLSLKLSTEFGKGFTVRNLQQMKSFILYIQLRTHCVRN